YAYNPTKTEVLAKDERITTESAGTPIHLCEQCINNAKTQGSQVPAYVFTTSPLKEMPNTHFKQSPNNSFHDSLSPVDICCVPGIHTDVRVCPSANTGRPWPSVSTHRTSGCPSVHISARSVDCLGDFGPRGLSVQYTQDVRQHTQDVRGCPCVSVCPSVHAGRPSAHTGRPSAHAGVRGLSVCVRVSISAHQDICSVTHRTSVSTRRDSVVSVCVRVVRQCAHMGRRHTNRTSVRTRQDVRHTRRKSVAVSVVRVSVSPRRTSVQYTQDVRQAQKDVVDVRQPPHRTSVRTQRTVRGRPSAPTQGVRQHTTG
ncbi:hypothetical protein IGI04_043106, partial [Brassica rapa subsp. trilocularis]